MHYMNLVEAIDLLAAVSDFDFKNLREMPNFSIYDKQNDGFVLCVKANLVNEEYRNFLQKTVESRNLWMRELNGYLIVSG